MKRPKTILENIPKEDIEQMKEAEKILKIEIYDGEYKQIPKTKAKADLWEQYYWGLNRATFHRTACQIKGDIHYHFVCRFNY